MNFTASKRTITGKATKALRNEGLIPAELYGKQKDNVHLAVDKKAFSKLWKEAGESSVVTLEVDGKKHPVMIHDLSFHPVTSEIESIDFYEVNMNEEVTADVPLVFVGESAAVKNDGAILVKVMQSLEVEALPANLPHEITVDISSLSAIGSSIHLKDLSLPKDVKIDLDPEAVIVTIKAQMTEEEELALRNKNADVNAIEIAGKKKEEEPAEGETAEAAK
ncbi:MAG: 50S ribosomal protein L25 [Candidatus Harrisonbacteria bacterium]|nr:50S ribosomal protein L25 [Candidatus Harrisonbacteria bacterium]